MDKFPVCHKPVENFLMRYGAFLPEYALKDFRTSTWESLVIIAFWSSPIATAAQWVKMLCRRNAGISGILESSLLFFHPIVFFRFFPLEVYVQEWPYMRGFCTREAFSRRGMYDMIWSLAAAASPFVPPLPAWFDLTDDERAFLLLVLNHMGKRTEHYSAPGEKEAGTLLERLRETGFLDDADGCWFRASAYAEYQVPRPIVSKKFRMKDGFVRTFTNAQHY